MKKVDRRVLKTKRAIQKAVVELLKEKSFEELTVNEITEKADIHRGTFYLHYLDKYDVIESWEEEILEEIKEVAAGEDLPLKIAKSFLMNEPAEEIIQVLTLLDDRREVVRVLLSSSSEQSFENKMKNFFKGIFKKNIEGFLNQARMSIPIDYFREYVISAHFGVLRYWLEEPEETRLAPEEIAKIISDMAFEGPMQVSSIKEQIMRIN